MKLFPGNPRKTRIKSCSFWHKMACVLFVVRVPCEPDASRSKSSENTAVDQDKLDEPVEYLSLPRVKSLEVSDEVEGSDDQQKEPRTPSPDVEFVVPSTTSEVLENILQSCNIQGDLWQITKDQKMHQVTFLVELGDKVDAILNKMTTAGIGMIPRSSISIVPTTLHIGRSGQELDLKTKYETDEGTCDEVDPLVKPKRSSKEIFVQSMKSKLTVAQVVEAVQTQARLTFDYLMFTILASLITAVGLMENNSIVLVAGMLVSPLMGPILGVTFGNQIKQYGLRNMGLRTEVYGLITAVLVGLIFGFIRGPFTFDGMGWDSNQTTWPTTEMASRGMLRGWWVGVLIALPSGACVALSVLGGNAGPLVGVAISASLLSPAVNSGMLWAYSIICAIRQPTLAAQPKTNDTQVLTQTVSKCPAFKDNSYQPTYSCNMAEEAATMAAVSLVLTIINIICILITGTLVLKLKEVLPGTSSSNATVTFWTKDIKVAREAYQTMKGDTATNLKDRFLKEWKKASKPEYTETQQLPQSPTMELLGLVQGVEQDPSFQNIVARAPQGQQKIYSLSRNLMKQMSDEGMLEDETMTLFPLHMTIPRQYAQPALKRCNLERIFEQPATEEKPTKGGREFRVTETERPYLTSIVRVRPLTKDTENYAVLTESGV